MLFIRHRDPRMVPAERDRSELLVGTTAGPRLLLRVSVGRAKLRSPRGLESNVLRSIVEDTVAHSLARWYQCLAKRKVYMHVSNSRPNYLAPHGCYQISSLPLPS